MHRSFESLRERLLRAGIAPRHVRRYLRELAEHLCDLVADERAAGRNEADAEARASAMLGSDDVLFAAIVSQGKFRSLSARAPWAVFAVLPPLAVVGVMLALTMVVASVLIPWPGVYRLSDLTGPSAAELALVSAATFIFNFLVGPAAAAMLVAIAIRQRLSSFWPLAGVAFVAITAAIFTLRVGHAPHDPHGGMIAIDLAPFLYGHRTTDMSGPLVSGLRALLTVLPIAAIFRADAWGRR